MEIIIHKQNCFTLKEILTVIAIIALLMARSMPSLQWAWRQAKAVKYQANLHQWGLAFSAYTIVDTLGLFRSGIALFSFLLATKEL